MGGLDEEVKDQKEETKIVDLDEEKKKRKPFHYWTVGGRDYRLKLKASNIEKLENKGYINDARYCEDQISSLKAAFNGNDKIIKTLVKKGIPYEMIVDTLNARKDDEEENAIAYAEKLLNSCKNDSVKKSKNYVYNHLVMKGYSSQIARSVSEKMDYTRIENKELDNLSKCCVKAKKRYEKKYQGTELKNRVFRYCMAQGYAIEDIYVVIDEMEW